MNKKYNVVLIITLLLIILSVSISLINYYVSKEAAHKQLKEHSLPLSLDNIYTEIQKNIIEPYLVSSMMANDTFVQNWIINNEKNENDIIKYLESIRNKYGMFNTFLVSDKSGNYYTQKGVEEVIKKDNPLNKWYYDFKESQEQHQINLDFNNHLSNDLIMFINYKIFDSNFHFIGVTGLALKISYIDDMLKKFRLKHNFIVTFFNKKGDIVLAERDFNKYSNIEEMHSLNKHKDRILSKESQMIEYEENSGQYLVNTKFIPELNLYLTVSVKETKYVEKVKNIFYLNLLVSLFITSIIAIVLFYIIKKNDAKLEYMAQNDSLTCTLNRRSFEEKLNRFIISSKRKNTTFSLLFMDIDDFKKINDSFGHQTGDVVLSKISEVLKNAIRKNDLIARWGGEEFVIVLKNSSLEDSKIKAEELRYLVEQDLELQELTSSNVTGSFGLTKFNKEDTLDTIVARADKAMYQSKANGKNKITIL
jgi:diguanylate cyclase (GGDEF)-like protein